MGRLSWHLLISTPSEPVSQVLSMYFPILTLSRGPDPGAQSLNTTDSTLKGVLGVKAMSLISEAVGNRDDAQHYTVSYAFLFYLTIQCSQLVSFFPGYGYQDGSDMAFISQPRCIISTMGTNV